MQALESDRHKWTTSENLKKYYEVLQDIFIKAEVAVPNPLYNPDKEWDPANPLDPETQPIRITRPDLIVSYDETEASTDASGGSRKGAKTNEEEILRAKRLGDQGECTGNKTSSRATSVGGSYGDGESLAAYIIFNGEPTQEMMLGGPVSTLVGTNTGMPYQPKFTFNGKGGINYDNIHDCMHKLFFRTHKDDGTPLFHLGARPCRFDTPTQKRVILCDGLGTHTIKSVLQLCRSNRTELSVRVQHTSHVCQNEDIKNYRCLKPKLRKSVSEALAAKMASGQLGGLTNRDLMTCMKGPWEESFTKAVNVSGWLEAGLIPFTMKPYWKVLFEERRAARVRGEAEVATEVDFTRMMPGGVKNPQCRAPTA
jgi:hypothetical protein